MTVPDYQLAKLARFLRRSFAFACVASLLLGSSTNAGTILQYSQVLATDTLNATVSGSTTTLATTGNVDGGGLSIPVIVSNFAGTPEPPGFVLFETFVGVTSTGAATDTAGIIQQTYKGTIEFTSAPGGLGVNFLTANFTSAMLVSIGNSVTLQASTPGLAYTSSVAAFDGNEGFGIGISNPTPPLSVTGGVLSPFTAQNAGTFSATIVPEPGTLCLASIAVVIGTLAYGRKRMKIEG